MKKPTYSKHTVIDVLRIFKIRYTSDYIKKMLEENSDGDNLWGILTVLKIYGLIVDPRKITNPLGAKNINIRTPFITEYENNILIIKEIKGYTVVGYANGKEMTYSKDDFFSKWSGLIVSIHKGESVGEPNIKRHIRSNLYSRFSRIAIILSVLTICIYRAAFFYVPFYIYLCFILSVLGAVMSYYIELSRFSQNGLMHNLCSLIKHSSCDQIITRKDRYITALGFSYFCSLCVFILFPLYNYTLINCIVIISSIEVVWSLLLQLKKQKFCINCIVVQTIVITMILICIPNLAKLQLHNFILQGMLYLSIFTIIFSVSAFQIWPYIENQYKYKSKSRMTDYFKREYLDNYISSEESTIKIFLNPFCSPCKEDFLASYNLLINQRQPKVIPIIIVSNSKGEKAGMSIINGGNTTSIFHLLKEWYSWGYRNPENFEQMYKVSPNDEIKLADALKCNLNQAHTYNVQYTPSILYHGIILPTGISLVDVLTQ